MALGTRVAIVRIRWPVGRAEHRHVARDDGRLLRCGTSAGLMPASGGAAYSALKIKRHFGGRSGPS